MKVRTSRRSQRTLYSYVLSISITMAVIGYASGSTSPALYDLRQRSILTEQQASWFASLLLVGGMFGSLVSSLTIQKLGRRGSLLVSNAVFILSFGMIWYFTHVSIMYSARLLAGLASGVGFAAAQAFVSEISTNELRGTLGGFAQLAVTIGIAFAFLIDTTVAADYKVLSIAGIVLTSIALVRLIPLFDSPQWYATSGRRQTALATLTLLRGSSDVAEDELSTAGYDGERHEALNNVTVLPPDSIVSVGVPSQSAFSYFKSATFIRPLTVSVGLMAVQQFSGVSPVLFYANDILSASTGAAGARYGALAIALAQVLTTLAATSLIERAGRKQLLLISLLIMFAACLLLATSYHTESTSDGSVSAATAWLAVLALLVYIIGYSVGCGPVPMIIMTEIFETHQSAFACGVSVFANWLFTFVITLYFPLLATLFGRTAVFAAFGGVCLVGFLFVLRFVPETRGKTISEVQQFFSVTLCRQLSL